MGREPISKKLRFDIFKRDGFTCKYCGRKSPDVILEVDHIKPVSKGGKNTVLNLITSCFDCNRGKGKRELSDMSQIDRQREAIEQLNEQKLQLDMLIKWNEEISDLKNTELRYCVSKFNSHFKNYSLSESSEKIIRKHISKYGLSKVIETIDVVYFKFGNSDDDEPTAISLCLNKLGMLLNVSNQPEHKRQINYIAGICRNKWGARSFVETIVMLNKYYEAGNDLDSLKKDIIAGYFRNQYDLYDLINKVS